MRTLCLHPVQAPGQSGQPEYLLIRSTDCRDIPLGLWTAAGKLMLSADASVPEGERVANFLYRDAANGNSQWFLSAMSSRLMHNGVRPLPLAIVEPGDLLAVDDRRWLVTELWQPVPAPAPERIAEKECSVCGGRLKLAPVIQCPCGRYYHLEHPESPGDPQALNCYLTAGMCGLCERKPSLTPQFLPPPPEELIPQESLELAIASLEA